MADDVRMQRGEFLAKGAAVVGGAMAAPLVVAAGARAAAGRALAGAGRGELGLVGLDHVGITVPDINQAIEWFEDVLGAVAPLTFGPFPAGPFVASVVDVAETASIDQITMLRIGHSANIELFQYTAPDGQRHDMPKNSDWSGHHVAFYVTDIDTAVEYMVEKGVRKMPAGPFTLAQGPAAGQTIQYFQTPWGGYIEFISYPDGMAYQVPSVKPLWSPKLNGTESVVTNVPGLLGIDHIGLTVPDHRRGGRMARAEARPRQPADVRAVQRSERRLHDAARRREPPRRRAANPHAPRRRRAEHRALPVHIAGSGPSVPAKLRLGRPPHRFLRPTTSTRASSTCRRKRSPKLFGPVTLTDGPAAGQSINYFHDPFGTDVELISYPHGMAYEATAPIQLWNPRDNHP